MKKAVLLMLSLFSALSLMFLSCSTDSSGGGSDPEFDVTICDRNKGDKDKWSSNGEDIIVYVTSKNYLKDIASSAEFYYADMNNVDADYVTGSAEVDDSSRYTDNNICKITLKGCPSVSGTYECYLTLKRKSNERVTKKIIFELTVSSEEKPAPKIDKQPVAGKEYYSEGETIDELSIVATISDNSTLVYQWYKDSNPIENATTKSYKPTEKGDYYVMVTGNGQSVKSDVVSIVVMGENDLYPVVITYKDDEKYSYSYDKISDFEKIVISAKSESEGTIYVNWYCGDKVVSSKTQELEYLPTDFGTYKAEVWVENGEKTSSKKTSRNFVISENNMVVTIDLSPNSEDGNVSLGTELKVTVIANVEISSIKYEWYKAAQITSDPDDYIENATTNSYTPTEVGKYGCKVTVKSKGGIEKSYSNKTLNVVATDEDTGSIGGGFDFVN